MDAYISKVVAVDAEFNIECKKDQEGEDTMEKSKVENKNEKQPNPILLQQQLQIHDDNIVLTFCETPKEDVTI